ncbi:type II toxin-antitoxin system VapC family toxin [Persicitalea jodogahamensis]|uniref:Motility twitching protein PilT n=1 Tax=Persicitalea jodogahamensis TaxID=402147 RepID=A0A8J3G7U0_9BACT|nr:type II toxin-antitoxin system VapC family toxin [Persicitalea jodogahamensis]GHB59803.1 motility twitching protein PilT [Persicitalea jodogahamensis]
MYLIDSNLIIYSSQSKFAYLRPVILHAEATVSEISRLETLGYHKITPKDERYFNSLFSLTRTLEIDLFTINKAIDLRKTRKMSVADAIIAATALLNDCELYSHNVQDFSWIEGLRIVDPILRNGTDQPQES